ncbi:peptidoglycan-binding domain-containing protein [Streptomyces cylindrosporus]|uniref:Peptidoglycan-binding protein n=1 Tax=Streptomyces cylindrosporus TaxID=2927583 RepID=A0ABS9YCT8_9ACTN|nr:peptidoglycan-binding domain-containing protein [Streptomyces cylindrosporus]MCI3275010.1 peptidoglycan-binding protein [Streptomyces cylindrosporus]
MSRSSRSSRTWRRKAVAVALVAAALGGGAITLAEPASASVSQGYIAGTGSASDDWKDEGTLSSTSHAKSNATALVQVLLWADGAKEKDGTTFDYADIDGKYGPNTTAAVKSWQKKLNSELGTHLTVDGKAGPKTLDAAGESALWNSSSTTVTYNGWKHQVVFKRTSGKYYLKVNNSHGWKLASYSTLNVV